VHFHCETRKTREGEGGDPATMNSAEAEAQATVVVRATDGFPANGKLGFKLGKTTLTLRAVQPGKWADRHTNLVDLSDGPF